MRTRPKAAAVRLTIQAKPISRARATLTTLMCAWILAACAALEKPAPPATTVFEGPPISAAETITPPEVREPASMVRSPIKPAAPTRAAALPRLPRTGGAYFQNDGPGDNPPANLEQIPDARPRAEPLASWANRPYVIFGRQYVPEREIRPYRERGVASWYGRKFHGNKTAIGERYDMYGMTAAHPTLPIPSYARVTNLKNGLSVVVRVNDRGPFLRNRVIDLSFTAAHRLGYLENGHAEVEVEQIAIGDHRLPEPGRMLTQGPAVLPRAGATNLAIKGMSETSLTEVSSNIEVASVSQAPMVYLQLGAFQNRDNAQWALQYMEEHLDELAGRLAILEEDGWYKVQAGPFERRQDARQMREQIRQATDFTPFIAIRTQRM